MRIAGYIVGAIVMVGAILELVDGLIRHYFKKAK